MTIPMQAMTTRTMIWRTANSTEVNSRHRARPSRAGRVESGGPRRSGDLDRRAARERSSYGRATAGSARSPADGVACRSRPRSRGEDGRRAASSAWAKSVRRSSTSSRPTEQRSSPAAMPVSASSASRQLAMGRRRRVGDDRVDAAERRGPLGDRQRIDERPPGDPATGDLEREHPAAGPQTGARPARPGGGSARPG